MAIILTWYPFLGKGYHVRKVINFPSFITKKISSRMTILGVIAFLHQCVVFDFHLYDNLCYV